MQYQEFCHYLLHVLPKDFPENTFLRLKEQVQSDGQSGDLLTIRAPGDPEAPAFPLRMLYDSYVNGLSITQIREQIGFEYALQTCREGTSAEFTAEYVRAHVCFRLINRSRYELQLSRMPHRLFLDLALIYELRSDVSDGEFRCILLRNDTVNALGMTEAELFSCARDNAVLQNPPEILSIEAMLEQLQGPVPRGSGRSESTAAVPMYVISNRTHFYGASVFAYPDFIRELCNRFGSFYLLPSSVHELLLIPDGDAVDPGQLSATVREINRTILQPQDFLSDHIYHCPGDGCLKML